MSAQDSSLFIVDNSVSGWTGIRYLRDWTELAKSFDIATGYFEIGSLLALDGKWQGLEKIRILMGGETSSRSRVVLLKEVKARTEGRLNESIEKEKHENPFLTGVSAIVDALKSGKIECRVYTNGKFHAKAYITHAKMEVVGAQALVGSSNFTKPGLTENIELNIRIQSGREVAQLQEWFNTHWEEAEDVSKDILSIVDTHVRNYSPFDVYAKALQEFFRGHELSADEWDESVSKVFHKLDRYQQEAYWSLMKIARQHGGAFLCDGVGLGKTYVGLMLIERLIMLENKRVVLFAPKGAKESVWEPHLRELLPHVGGIGGGVDFSNLAVFSHTDLGRKGEYPERFRRITDLADVVLIDEAHHFRNPGRRGNAEEDTPPSRYYQLFDLLDRTTRAKTMFMLTATPINNRLSDFKHMLELFTRRDDTYFARTLGVNNLTAHFRNIERELRQSVGYDPTDISDDLYKAKELLSADTLFNQIVVQRSRAYARESQKREGGTAVVFPQRDVPQVAGYSIRKSYGHLLEMFERAFERKNPLFTLPMYSPLCWYIGSEEVDDPFEEGRQSQIVGLIRTNFLKRFESSVVAFEMSCDRLLKKLLAFVEVHSETEGERRRLERWKSQNAGILGYTIGRQFELWGEVTEDAEDEDIAPQEMLEDAAKLDRKDYDVPEMLNEAILDMTHIVQFLEELRKFDPAHDDKLKKLIRLLRTKELTGQKVLIFTEFADTARYLLQQLRYAGIEDLEQVDSCTKKDRADVIRRFAPYYNDLSSTELVEMGKKEIKVLISTDVLSEGLNLQDATY
ncbi:MAG: helicase, partial [Sphaerochaetaceae bacterium]|nr:helicase [Sphaerochaetaceae bacterium]